eukprot:SAG31_NODE_3744_length_3929_cov_2.697911_2_plen_102_part_00
MAGLRHELAALRTEFRLANEAHALELNKQATQHSAEIASLRHELKETQENVASMTTGCRGVVTNEAIPDRHGPSPSAAVSTRHHLVEPISVTLAKLVAISR